MAETSIHRESFRVRCYETDPKGRLTLPALLDLFQEAAWNHARELGLSVPELQEQGLTWVLFRLHVMVEAYPAWGDVVQVETWPSGIQGLRFFRDFRVLDHEGRSRARGTTAYMVLDLRRRRPVKLNDERTRFPVRGERALNDLFAPLPEAPADGPVLSFPVLRGDVDMNGHVNTTAYVRWLLESAPPEAVPTGLEVHYREECFLGDTIHARSAPAADGTLLHTLSRGDSARRAAVAVSRWNPGGSPGTMPA